MCRLGFGGGLHPFLLSCPPKYIAIPLIFHGHHFLTMDGLLDCFPAQEHKILSVLSDWLGDQAAKAR